MKVIELPLAQLTEAPWNANQMDEAMLARLRTSIERYGLVQNLVVRKLMDGSYELLSGNQRLRILTEKRFTHAPCVVVKLDDAQSRLLAQALNRIQGTDDLGLRAEAVREMLKTIPETDVLAVLPETAAGLKALASMGKETVAEYLQAWQKAQGARLKHFQFQVTACQQEVIDEALARILPMAKQEQGSSPNARGTGLYLLARFYLEKGEIDEQ